MKKQLLFILLLFPLILFGQTANDTYKFGPAFNNSKGFSYPGRYVYPEHNTFNFTNPSIVVSVRISGDPLNQTIQIQCFDKKNLTELSSNKYTDFERSSKIQGFSKTTDALYLLYSTYSGDEFYVRKIDINNGTMGKSKLLFKGPKLAYTYGHDGIIYSLFKVSTSLDSSKVLISCVLNPENTNNNTNHIQVGYQIFSNSMEKIWDGVVKMPYIESTMEKLGSTVSNKGDVYQLIFSKTTKKFEILAIKSQTNIKIGKTEISTDANIVSADVNETQKGNFSCTALYGGSLENREVKGILRFQVNLDLQIVYSTKIIFDDAFANEIGPAKANIDASLNSDSKRGILYLKLLQVNEYADGTSLIINEQQSSAAIISGDIILVKIDKIGNVTWMIKIPKATGHLAEWGRFYADQESVYVFFLDSPKNAMSTKKPVRHYTTDPGDLVLYKINKGTGVWAKQIVFSTKDEDVSGLNNIIDDLLMIDKKTFITIVMTKKGTQTRLLKIQVK
jgi:hypothetical protein